MKIGDCDCCGEHRELRRVIYLGMDTDVCDECVGDNEFDVAKPEATPEYEHEDWIDKTVADRIDGYDRDDLGESPDY